MKRTHLEDVLAGGGFALTAELPPPHGADSAPLRAQVRRLGPLVDALNFVDNAVASPRMSSLAAARLCLEEGVEPVLQVTCRDRNSVGIQSDILGAAALGIANVLCLTGDHPTLGNHPFARGVYELDSIQLIQLLRQMRDQGKLLNGQALAAPPRLFIGGAKNPFSGPLELRVLRLGQKIAAGAEFIQTQPVLDLDHFRLFMEQVRQRGYHARVPIVAGVLLFRSHKELLFMQDHLPGTRVPPALVRRVQQAADPLAEALAVAAETVQALAGTPGVRGVHFMCANVRAEEAVPAVLERSGLGARRAGVPSG